MDSGYFTDLQFALTGTLNSNTDFCGSDWEFEY